MSEPTWTKQLDEKFILLEFPKEPKSLSCAIHYVDGEFEQTFFFGSWGMDRDAIAVADCVICCQVMSEYDANVAISSFASNLEYARSEEEEEDEDWNEDDFEFELKEGDNRCEWEEYY